jgi:hypothetical protein
VASWADLKELRLRISDPSGVIAIETVATAAARLVVPAPAKQTAYQQADDDTYWVYDFDLLAWSQVELEIADIRIENIIDLYGLDAAAPKCLRLIMSSIGKRMGIVRSGSGAESIQYQTLKDTYDFYKAIVESMEEEVAQDTGASTGRYMRFHHPRIGGDM